MLKIRIGSVILTLHRHKWNVKNRCRVCGQPKGVHLIWE